MIAIREESHTGRCELYFEDKVRIGQSIYYIIFGRHANGYFVALPEWGVSCNLEFKAGLNCTPGSLIAAGLPVKEAKALSDYIFDWIDQNGDYAFADDDVHLEMGWH